MRLSEILAATQLLFLGQALDAILKPVSLFSYLKKQEVPGRHSVWTTVGTSQTSLEPSGHLLRWGGKQQHVATFEFLH